MTPDQQKQRVIVHFDQTGDISYMVESGSQIDLLIIDERAPRDRVYRWNPRHSSEAITALIGSGDIGSNQDKRHAAVEALVLAFLDGRPHLQIEDPEA